MPVNANPLTPAERARIDELLASGMSQKKISKEVGRAQSTISLHAKRTGQTPVH
jgi:IS30 family transposase